MPRLARIQIYPIKSLDAHVLDTATLLPGGGLQHDRRFVLVDTAGNYLNGKRTAAVHRLRTRYDLAAWRVTFRIEGTSPEHSFHLDDDRPAMRTWLSNYFGSELDLLENPDGGFPDDLEFPGPTVISTGSLQAVAGWFEGLDLDAARQRFRANLEIDGVEPFWEDRLLGPALSEIRFRVGNAELLGANPCARCIVPSRDAQSGEMLHGFAKEFARRRKEFLPEWAPRERFDHFYRLAVNTRPTSSQVTRIHVGDVVQL